MSTRSEYRKQRRETLQSIAELESEARTAAAAALNPKNDRDLIVLSQAQVQMKSDHARKMLEVYESEWLMSVGLELGIEHQPHLTTYAPRFKDFKSRAFFLPEAKAVMYRMIAAKRRENREHWSRFLAPWFAVGIAFLALILAIISLFVQYKR